MKFLQSALMVLVLTACPPPGTREDAGGLDDAVALDGAVAFDGGTGCGEVLVAHTATLQGTTRGRPNRLDWLSYWDREEWNRYPGPEQVFRLTVPPRSRVVVTTTGAGEGTFDRPHFEPTTALLTSDSCGAGVTPRCLAASTGAVEFEPDVVAWSNGAETSVEVLLSVDSIWQDGVTGIDTDGGLWVTNVGDFVATVTTTPLEPAPAHDRCVAPAPLAEGLSAGTTVGAVGGDVVYSPGVNCGKTQDASDVFYSASVPPGQRLTVEATPTTPGVGLMLSLFAGPCGAVEGCDVLVFATVPGLVERRFDNLGTAAQGVAVRVATMHVVETSTTSGTIFSTLRPPAVDPAAPSGAFSLTTTIAPIPPPPPNDACAAPQPLVVGTVTSATLMSAHPTSVGASGLERCSALDPSMLDVYFVVDVPPAQSATFTVTPSSRLDLVVDVLDSAASCENLTRCAASSSSGGPGELEVVSLTNDGGVTRPVLVRVASWSGGDGDFTIAADVR